LIGATKGFKGLKEFKGSKELKQENINAGNVGQMPLTYTTPKLDAYGLRRVTRAATVLLLNTSEVSRGIYARNYLAKILTLILLEAQMELGLNYRTVNTFMTIGVVLEVTKATKEIKVIKAIKVKVIKVTKVIKVKVTKGIKGIKGVKDIKGLKQENINAGNVGQIPLTYTTPKLDAYGLRRVTRVATVLLLNTSEVSRGIYARNYLAKILTLILLEAQMELGLNYRTVNTFMTIGVVLEVTKATKEIKVIKAIKVKASKGTKAIKVTKGIKGIKVVPHARN
jgi:hypothetical protein